MVMLVLLLVGTFLPVVLAEVYDAGPGDYGLIQMSSFPALLQHVQFQGAFNRAGFTPSVGDVALPFVAAIVLLVNLVFVGAEVRRKREATPERVLAERQASMLVPTQPAPDA
jgi:hypothetical protein